MSVMGAASLTVVGRKTGRQQRIPVNPMVYDGVQYLVSPRGNGQWVRNIRAAGTATLGVGRRQRVITVRELADTDAVKPEILRAYLRRWNSQAGGYFDGLTPDSPVSEFAAKVALFPVFAVSPAS
jgi:deazaflavin-dependent oxidoreductase (nitroreductase family)